MSIPFRQGWLSGCLAHLVSRLRGREGDVLRVCGPSHFVTMRRGPGASSLLGRVIPAWAWNRRSSGATSRLGRDWLVWTSVDASKIPGRCVVSCSSPPKQGPCASVFLPNRDVVAGTHGLHADNRQSLRSKDNVHDFLRTYSAWESWRVK